MTRISRRRLHPTVSEQHSDQLSVYIAKMTLAAYPIEIVVRNYYLLYRLTIGAYYPIYPKNGRRKKRFEGGSNGHRLRYSARLF